MCLGTAALSKNIHENSYGFCGGLNGK